MKVTLIITLLASLLMGQVLKGNQQGSEFITVNAANGISAAITEFDYNVKNDRVYFHWTVSDNEAADNFELECSTDGVNFSSKALVFGTDLPQMNDYKMFLKKSGKTSTYRIKITQKDKTVHYHPVFITVR